MIELNKESGKELSVKEDSIPNKLGDVVNERDRRWTIGINFDPIFLSNREKVILDGYMRGGSYKAGLEAYRKTYPDSRSRLSESTVRRWVLRDHVQRELFERIKTNAIYEKYAGEDGKKAWLRDMIEYREGIKGMDKFKLVIMDLIGKYMGYARELSGTVNIGKQQINFYQGDGSR